METRECKRERVLVYMHLTAPSAAQLALVAFELSGAAPGDVHAARKAWLGDFWLDNSAGELLAARLAAVPESFVGWVAARAGLGELFCVRPQPEEGAVLRQVDRAEWDAMLLSMLDLEGAM